MSPVLRDQLLNRLDKRTSEIASDLSDARVDIAGLYGRVDALEAGRRKQAGFWGAFGGIVITGLLNLGMAMVGVKH